MTALSDNRSLDQQTTGLPAILQVPVDGGTHLYTGSSVALLTGTGMAAIGGGVAATGACVGIANHEVDNSSGADSALSVNLSQGVFRRVNSAGAALDATHVGKVVYAEDDQTVRSSSGATYPVLGIFLGFEADGTTPLVFVSAAVNYLLSQATLQSDLASDINAKGASMIGLEDAANNFTTASDVEAALAEIFSRLAAVTATNGANLVGFQDSGTKTLAATVDAALDELYVNATTAQGCIPIPLQAWFDADGDPIAKYNADPVPGFTVVDTKAAVIKWGSHATPGVIVTTVAMPQDLDDAAPVVFHAILSKSGATLADATTLTVAAYFQTVGALHDADGDCGGASSAVVGDLAAKTTSEVTLSIAAIDVLPAPCSVTLKVNPTDGLLGTDDIYMHSAWLEYTRKVLAA